MNQKYIQQLFAKQLLMGIYNFLMKPTALPYDYDEWKTLPYPDRIKKVCQAWATQGFGAPLFAPLFYVLKISFYVWMWTVFCSYSTELGGRETIGEWWFSLEALGKALLWTVLLEGIGFGGASGPLTARYVPPLGGSLYYLRPGTLKVPLFPKLPVLGGDKRNIFDVLVYAAWIYFMITALIAPEVTPQTILPIMIVLPVMGILDRQLYLVTRCDVWYPALFAFMFVDQTGSAAKIMWFGIWFWAAFSKLTPAFSSVVAVMICNSPILKMFKGLKKSLYVNYPEDLRLSKGANFVAHVGTVAEFLFPILLLAGSILGWSQETMFYCLVGMSAFHLFIFINFPIAVPLEWNVMMMYGGWLLFGMHPEFNPLDLNEPILIALLSIVLLVFPIIGNFFPKYVSFLLSMRYYAGTWAFSIWLFKGDAKEAKLDPNVPKTSPDLRKQLNMFYPEKTTMSILSRFIAFRYMHLPSRALHDVLPKAVDNIDDYYWIDGEFFIGELAGWNFGDGHLHHEPVLRSVQKRANYDSGELRVIMFESPQLHNGKMHWRIYDAKDGKIDEGHSFVKDLKDKMPWPTKWGNYTMQS